jgi:glucose-6-phosphate 1-dehydrogenase
MTSQIIRVEPFDFVIFGGTGDLAERKLLPALYHRQQAGQFSEPTRIIGASRSKMSDDEYRAYARAALSEHVKPEEIDSGELDGFVARPTSSRSMPRRGRLDDLRNAIGDSTLVFYLPLGLLLATSPPICKKHGRQRQGAHRVGKPIGRLPSARALNDQGRQIQRADFPHRPLSREGDAEPDGAAVCHRAV